MEKIDIFNFRTNIEKGIKSEIPDIDSLPIDEPRAWDNYSVISKLVEAADILLHHLDYDGDGWEQIQICHERGKEMLAQMRQNHV